MRDLHPFEQRDLDEFNYSRDANFRLRWNTMKQRWAIWVKLEGNSHPAARDLTGVAEYWSGEGWHLFFRTWESDSKEYLPIDQRLWNYLDRCDTRYDRHFFNENFMTEEEERATINKEIADIAADQASYTHNMDNPIFGMYGGGGDWRHRIR